MAIFGDDPSTAPASDLGYAVDTAQIAATGGESSIAGSIADFTTKGIPIITRSIINSFTNTGISVLNWFGADVEHDDFEQSLQDADSTGDMLTYYQQRKTAMDASALFLGSIIPGTVALKALKVAQMGKLGVSLARATNILAGPQQKIIDGAVAEITSTGGIFNSVRSDMLKAISLGYGEQAMQAGAWELATAATMSSNPIMADQDYKDITRNIITGAVLGGFIGGTIEAIGISHTFKQAKLFTEANKKLSELSERAGIGAYNAGDRVSNLIESVYAIPEKYDQLGKVMTTAESTKFTANRNAAILDAKLMLKKISPEDDPEVSNSLFDALVRMRDTGAATKEDMYSYLGRAARIQRVNEFTGIPDSEYLLIPEFTDASKMTWETMTGIVPTKVPYERGTVINKALDDAVLTRAYRVRPGSTDPIVARADDAVYWEGMSKAKYTSPEDAFHSGADIFVDSSMKVHVNPESEILQQIPRRGENRILTAAEEKAFKETGVLPQGKDSLLGASVTLNLKSGAVMDSAVPVVGDLAKSSEIRLAADGNALLIGDRVSRQTVESGVNWLPTTLENGETIAGINAVNANARTVWASLRGIKNGDTIQYNDIPMLEQLYRETGETGADFVKWNMQKVSIMDETGLATPLTESKLFGSSLQEHILQQKRNLVTELSTVKDANLAETALKVNAPREWIENGMKSDWENATIDPALHTQVNHVRISYDVAGPQMKVDGNVVRGMLDTQARIRIAQDQARNAAANFFGQDSAKYFIQRGADEANQLGSRPGFVSFANADAKTLAADTQYSGQQITLRIQNQHKEASEALNAYYHALTANPEAGAELGVITHLLRRTPDRYAFLPAELIPGQVVKNGKLVSEGMGQNVLVLEKSIVRDADGIPIRWNQDYHTETTKRTLTSPDGVGMRQFYELKNSETADFLRANQALNDERLLHHNNWLAAQGIYNEISPGSVYVPPIDTNKYKFVAFVRDKEGSGMGSSSVTAITADNAERLQAKVSNLGDRYDVFYKQDLKKNHQVLGDYDYNMNLVQNTVDDALKKQGVLSDITPTTSGETVAQEFVDWNMRQITRLNRNYMELANAQLFAELRALGSRYTGSETSKVGYVASAFASTAENPYKSYINTSLGISEKSTYRLWQDANEKVEQYFSTAFRAAKETFGAASKGLLPYDEASKLVESYGLGNPFAKTVDALTQYNLANRLPPKQYLQGMISQIHTIISATAIRLDEFQNLINIVSTPVMLMSQASAVRSAALKELTSVAVPGTNIAMPSATKAVFGAVNDFFNPEIRAAFTPLYENRGWVRAKTSDYISMLNDTAKVFSGEKVEAIQAALNSAVDKGAQLMGSNAAERMVRWIATRTGHKLYEASGMEGEELWSAVNTFVNRVHGNYIASQRPIAFQGPLGQAIGLFQTYQLNLMQQVFKHIENGEGKSLAIIAGLQTTLFGLQGLPGFQALSTHIVGNAAGNAKHEDLYSGVSSLVNKDLGNWMLYGSVSNFLGAGLYTRGDINPRQITILPVNPLNFPAVSGSIRFVQALHDTFSKVNDGGSLLTSILNGVEHNGLSRPLTGIAQTIQGYATTGQGKLIGASNDWVSVATASRILGARPLDEAIAMDAAFRVTAYRAKDSAAITQLGAAVKTAMYNGQSPTEEQTMQFMGEYAARGGRIENFGKHMVSWMRDANIPVANAMAQQLGTSGGQYMQKVMGGVQLQGFNSPSASSSGTLEAGSTLPAQTQ